MPSKTQGSISGFFKFSAEEASRGIQAIKQTEQDIRDGDISVDDIPDWGDMGDLDSEKKLYKPSLK
jgi:hypothetical protein